MVCLKIISLSRISKSFLLVISLHLVVLTKSYKNRHGICFWLSARVFSNCQQSKHQGNISIAKNPADYLNSPWYEMKGCRLYARVLQTDNHVARIYFLFIIIFIIIFFIVIIIIVVIIITIIIIIIIIIITI